MKKSCLVAALWILQNLMASAQEITPPKTTLGNFVSASPEASAIALYQNYPVDFVSGVPDISIPLFEVPTRVGVIPFKLTYHVGKLKPSEQIAGPGWGWTLSPNLGVSRAVKGGIDGVGGGYPANTQFGQNTQDYLLGAALNGYDEQPDDFFYSLLSKSGQFIYNRSGQFVPVSYDAAKVSHPDNNTFIITDDDGTIYKFGKYSTGSQTLTEYSGNGTLTTLAAWKVTEIIPYDKSDTIRFTYGVRSTFTTPYYNIQWKLIEYVDAYGLSGHKTPHMFLNVFNSSSGVSSGLKVLRPTSASKGPYYPSEPFDWLPLFQIGEQEYKFTLTTGSPSTPNVQAAWRNMDYGTDQSQEVTFDNVADQLPLSEISFKGGRLAMFYSDQKQLSSILLYSGNQIIKRVSLFQHALQHDNGEQPYSYYDNLNTRYGLDSVKILGIDNNKPLVYKMDYDVKNGESCVGVYSNYNTDFWGFLNDKREFIVPHFMYYSERFVWHSALENPNTADTSGATKSGGGWLNIGSQQEKEMPGRIVPGIIKRLYYPTGGYAEFDFENNQYASSMDYTKIIYGGGYRIRQIKYATGDKRDSITKVYKYGVNEDGVGKTKYKNYTANFVSVQYVNSTTNGRADNYLQKISTFNSKPFLDMSFASGAAVLYPRVTEYVVNPGTNQTIGKTVYDYIIDAKNDMWVNNTPLHSDPKDDWKIISMKTISKYRFRNGTYNIVSRKDHEYTDYYTDTVPAAQTYLRYYNVIPANGSDILAGDPPQVGEKFSRISYNIYCGGHKLTAIKDTLFDVDDSTKYFATIKNFNYENVHLYKDSESRNDSKGAVKKTTFYYAHQVNAIPDLVTGQLSLISSLEAENVLKLPIESKEYIGSTLLRTVQQNFAQYPNNRVFPSAVYTSTMNNPLEKRIEQVLYDINGNVLEQRKSGDMSEVFIWGYLSQYPVAKVVGSSYDSVKKYISQTILDNAQNYTDTQIRVELQKIRTGLSNTSAKVTTYTYKPLVGVTSETNPIGITQYYEYDNFGRLVVVRDQDGNILKQMDYQYQAPITK